MKNSGLSVKVGITKLTTPDNITFIHPFFGPNTYVNTMKKIDEAGLKRPTFRQNVSLVHAVYQNPNEKFSQEIITTILKPNWLISNTAILYLPDNEGVYFQDNPKTENGWPIMVKSELDKMLSDENPSVRFTDYKYNTGEMSKTALGKNPFVLGLTGDKKSAKMLAEIAGKHSEKPYLYAFDSDDVSEQEVRVFSLYSDWDWVRLFVDGIHGDYRLSCAFGVAPDKKQ